jgi:hypothetical protein
MKMFKNILLTLGCAALLSSCAVTLPYAVTNNSVGVKKGTSTTMSIGSGLGQYATTYTPNGLGSVIFHGIIFNKEFGIEEACKKGKITKIGSVDFKVTSYIFVTKQEWIVTGE